MERGFEWQRREGNCLLSNDRESRKRTGKYKWMDGRKSKGNACGGGGGSPSGPGSPSIVRSAGVRKGSVGEERGVGKNWCARKCRKMAGLRLASPNPEGLRCGKLGQ